MEVHAELRAGSCVLALNTQLRDKIFSLTQDSISVCQKYAEIFPTTTSSSLFFESTACLWNQRDRPGNPVNI